jgi:hypothetical protein
LSRLRARRDDACRSTRRGSIRPAGRSSLSARHESLRDLALAYGVSHETIRAIVRRVGAAARAAIAMAADWWARVNAEAVLALLRLSWPFGLFW